MSWSRAKIYTDINNCSIRLARDVYKTSWFVLLQNEAVSDIEYSFVAYAPSFKLVDEMGFAALYGAKPLSEPT